jgi:hypothetical protein
MNILYLVLGCKNPHYTPIENAAKETWLKNPPKNIKTIFMYGGSDKIYWDNKESFYVDRPESHNYNICLYKTITAFEWFIESEFDYIFRCNCTGYFDLHLVSKFLEDKPLEKFYCGYCGELDGVNFASGSGYFLSKDLVVELVKNKKLLYDYGMPGWFDDVMVGKFITQFLGIPINPSAKRIDINPKDIPEDLDMSCYHYRVINNGDVNSLYHIHELKCKNQ